MTTRSDAKLDALETVTGNTGHVLDLEAEYLVSLGATPSKAIVDQWFEVFDNAGTPAGAFNDRFMSYMATILALASSSDLAQRNDREIAFWLNVGGGAPVVPVPPAAANLLHWFDFTDAPTVFQDVGGTVLATNGSNVRNVTNKGSDGQAMVDAGTVPKYIFGVINGLNALDDSATAVLATIMANGSDAAGFTFASVARRTDSLFGAAPFAGWDFVTELNHASLTATGWRTRVPGDALFNTGKADVTDEWVWNYGAIDAAGNRAIQTSGAPPIGGAGTYGAVAGGESLQFLGGNGQLAEFLIWDRALTPTELTALVAYFDAKFTMMPFIPIPPAVSTLIHHYDFTDNATVFKNPPATQLANDGDTIRVLKDKGANAADLTTPNGTDAPTYRVAYVNGENVADFSPGSNSKPMTGTDLFGTLGTNGMTNAVIFRVEDPVGGAVQLVDWSDGATKLRGLRGFGAGNMQWDLPGPPGSFSLAPHVPGNWYLWYSSFTGVSGSSDDRVKLSGEASQSQDQLAPTSIPPGEPIGFEHVTSQNFQIAEWAVWEGPLTDAELAELVDYADAKYGTLPHGDTSVPAVGDLLHHVDASDASTVWADAAATIPATNGVTVERIDNKGTRGTPFLRVGFGGVEYKTGVLAGENVIEFQSANGQLTIVAESPGLAISTTGCTLAAVVRRRSALGAGTGILWRWTPFGGVPGPGIRHASITEDFITIIDGIANETLKAATVLDTWYLVYISIDPAGAVDDATFGSPGPEVVAAIGNPTDIPDLADIRWGTSIATMEQAEAFFWDRPLTLAERAQLVAYINGKYGTLPHL